jgi:hypothetical protein
VRKKACQTHGYGLKEISLENICELNEMLFIGCEAVYSITNYLNPLISEAGLNNNNNNNNNNGFLTSQRTDYLSITELIWAVKFQTVILSYFEDQLRKTFSVRNFEVSFLSQVT